MNKEKATQIGYVRKADAPTLPPPLNQVGLVGWLWQNIFVSFLDFSSLSSTVKSCTVGLFTLAVLYFGSMQIYAFLDFTIFSAVWSDPDGLKREVCWTVEQGGILPSGWYGACWPFVWAKHKFIFYGAYPAQELWRVNLSAAVGFLGLLYLIIEGFP